MFAVVQQAEISAREFAAIAGVSRVTASLWIHGHRSPHILHAEKINKLLAVVSSAVKDGDLPLDKNILRKDRLHSLREVLIAHARKVKASA